MNTLTQSIFYFRAEVLFVPTKSKEAVIILHSSWTYDHASAY